MATRCGSSGQAYPTIKRKKRTRNPVEAIRPGGELAAGADSRVNNLSLHRTGSSIVWKRGWAHADGHHPGGDHESDRPLNLVDDVVGPGNCCATQAWSVVGRIDASDAICSVSADIRAIYRMTKVAKPASRSPASTVPSSVFPPACSLDVRIDQQLSAGRGARVAAMSCCGRRGLGARRGRRGGSRLTFSLAWGPVRRRADY